MTTSTRAAIAAAFKAAFPLTIPIMAGFLFLGLTCGIFAESLGLAWWMPTAMSIIIFAGSAEFTVASMLTGAFNPLQAFLVILVVNARHLFYGLSMLERFQGMGRKRSYLIYAMCDETFSINYATRAPEGVDEGWFMFFVSLLDQGYWVIGCTLGGIFGSVLDVDIKGIGFAMTALFVVIFLDQWMKDRNHTSAVVGVLASTAALLAFGAENFIIPAMIAILAIMTLLRGRLEPVLAPDGATGGATGSPGSPANSSDGSRRGGDAA